MPVDVAAAERFIFANARLLERHRAASLLDANPAAPVLDALRAYRNPDGGFGHALEPDVRAPDSDTVSTLTALEMLIAVGSSDDPMFEDAAAWVATVAHSDGGVPSVLATAASYPHAPWMVPTDDGAPLTFAVAAVLWEAGSQQPWLERATDWCWAKLEGARPLGGYTLKFALAFLDHAPDQSRAEAALQRLSPQLGQDGSVRVTGGTEDEQLTALDLSPQPGARSRALFSAEQIEADLDRLQDGQQADGGWTFDWLGWSPGQTVEWRGIVTLRALATLLAHGRIQPR
jgi:hypothetical protein